NLATKIRQLFGAHQGRAQGGELALTHFGKTMVKGGGHQKIEHGIAQKFEPFVVFNFFRMFVEVRAVGQGAAKQGFIAKGNPHPLLEVGERWHTFPMWETRASLPDEPRSLRCTSSRGLPSFQWSVVYQTLYNLWQESTSQLERCYFTYYEPLLSS